MQRQAFYTISVRLCVPATDLGTGTVSTVDSQKGGLTVRTPAGEGIFKDQVPIVGNGHEAV